MSFKKYKYQVTKKFLNKQTIEIIKNICLLHETNCYRVKPPTLDNPYPYNDLDCFESFSWYGGFVTESLLIKFKNKVSKIVKKDLVESYSYQRIYYNNCKLIPHVDRESCEYSVSICIQKDFVEWPLYLELENKTVIPVVLDEGDAIIYQGTYLKHWRDNFQGVRHVQFFLHYIDKNNIFYPRFMFDGRKTLGSPSLGIIR